jgi:hypothetical protein
MKVPINQVACIDLDAPTLPAERIKANGVVRWRVWCRHCGAWHYHGPAGGHREAHCQGATSNCFGRCPSIALRPDRFDELRITQLATQRSDMDIDSSRFDYCPLTDRGPNEARTT